MPSNPSKRDLLDAIEHANVEGQPWSLSDFSLKFLGDLSVEELEQFDDISSWLELDKDDFDSLSTPEKINQLEDFRGSQWAHRAREWIRTGIPPIVVITAPDEGVLRTQIGDGRGRINFAYIFDQKIPTWHLSFKKNVRTTIKELRNLIQESVSKAFTAKAKKAFFTYIKDNNSSKIEAILPQLLQHQQDQELSDFLDVGEHEYAYRLVDVNTESQLKKILGIDKVNKEKYGVKKDGVLTPHQRVLSSWTVNPRSLVYSGFFGVAKKPIFILFKAKIKKPNRFLGNPDALAGSLDVGDGYSLERETLGIGDIHYDQAVYGFKKKDQSSEGLMMDLINKLSNLDELEFTNDYYFPKKL